MDNCEKATQNLNKFVVEFDNKLITSSELETESRKFADLKMYAEEKRNEYEKSVIVTNLSWNKQFTNLTQFLQTMNSIDKDRQILVIAISDALTVQFQALPTTSFNHLKSIRKAFENSLNASQKISFINLQTKIEKLARISLSLSKMANLKFHFFSFENLPKNGENWLRNASLISTNNLAELSNKDKKDLDEIIADLFSSQIPKTKLKITDPEIVFLFSKEKAVLEFLLKVQKILSSEKFEFSMNESKFTYTQKIIRQIINRKIKRNSDQ